MFIRLSGRKRRRVGTCVSGAASSGRLYPGWTVTIFLLITLLTAATTSAQQNQRDTTRYRYHPVRSDSVSDAIADSILANRDSVFYSSLKTRMYKRKVTRQLYRLLFRDVYNSRIKTGEVRTIEENPFRTFEGKIIGDIYIRRLEVFGRSVYDTLRKPNNWLMRTANRLHTDTREGIIRRSFLLFRKGDRVDANQLRDNERLLRSSNIFHDARIIVVPRPGSQVFVDVYVITQDVWSLLPSGDVGGLDRFRLTLEQRNFRGLGHTFINSVRYDGRDSLQKLNYRGRYFIPYIGKTFFSGQVDFTHDRDLKQKSIRFFRPFLTPETRFAGSLELSHYNIRNLVFSPDTAFVVPLRYYFTDVWAGYAFRPMTGFMDPDDRTRMVVSARMTNYRYTGRPEVGPDTNQLYQNSRTLLFSVGYSTRRYIRDVLIYGFGRTEDVPYGNQTMLVGGVDYAELGRRVYMGIRYSRAQYIQKFGYLYGQVNLGGYYQSRRSLQQGIFNLETNYFSPLRTTSWGDWRHFLTLRYLQGLNRFNNESITIGGRDGLGVNNDGLRGTRFLLGGVENILFSRLNLVGFRVAVVTFANLGLITFPNRSLFRGPLYQAYGLGFRLRNENLTFNSFEIKLVWYPNLPNMNDTFRFGFEGSPSLRFRDFDITAPEIVPYR